MKRYTTFLFDWDGTLADSTQVWIDVVRAELAAHNLTATDLEIVRVLGDFGHMTRLGVAPEKLNDFRASARLTAAAQLPDAPLFAGALEVLTALQRQGKKLAVVTAMGSEIVENMLRHHQLQHFFDVVVSGTDVKALKPDPEALLLAMERLGVMPNKRVLMLGDAGRDILAAQNAGVDSLLFYPPEHVVFHDLSELQNHRPTHFITDWKEFLVQL